MSPAERAMTLHAWRRARRILCVRLDNMGDVLMTTPALRALKESGEGRHLTLLTSSAAAPLAAHLPMIDDVWIYDAPWVKHPGADDGAAADVAMIERLLCGGFDAAAIFTVYSQSPLPAAMMCRLAGIALRLAHCRENPYRLLTERIAETEPQVQLRHEVARQLALVREVGATTRDMRLAFEPGDAARRAVRARLRAARLAWRAQAEGARKATGGIARRRAGRGLASSRTTRRLRLLRRVRLRPRRMAPTIRLRPTGEILQSLRLLRLFRLPRLHRSSRLHRPIRLIRPIRPIRPIRLMRLIRSLQPLRLPQATRTIQPIRPPTSAAGSSFIRARARRRGAGPPSASRTSSRASPGISTAWR